MNHVVGKIAVSNLTNSTVTIRANLIPGQSRAIKFLPYKTVLVDRDIVVMALAEFRKNKEKGVIWFDENEINADSGSTGIGSSGVTGLQGATGVAGMGTTGLQGVTGFGIQGTTGLDGLGITGIVGATGPQGVTGLSVLNTFISTILEDNQTDAQAANLTFPILTEGIVITYKAKLISTNDFRVGTIYVASNGISTSIQDNYAETDDVGITWKTSVDLSNLYLLYSTSNKSSQRSIVSELRFL